jgi:hypothetical protein
MEEILGSSRCRMEECGTKSRHLDGKETSGINAYRTDGTGYFEL